MMKLIIGKLQQEYHLLCLKKLYGKSLKNLVYSSSKKKLFLSNCFLHEFFRCGRSFSTLVFTKLSKIYSYENYKIYVGVVLLENLIYDINLSVPSISCNR